MDLSWEDFLEMSFQLLMEVHFHPRAPELAPSMQIVGAVYDCSPEQVLTTSLSRFLPQFRLVILTTLCDSAAFC